MMIHVPDGLLVWLLQGIGFIAFTGWAMYLTNEKTRLIEDIKELKKTDEDQEKRILVQAERLSLNYWTKDDHKIFEEKLMHAIEKLSERLDSVIINHEARCCNFNTNKGL